MTAGHLGRRRGVLEQLHRLPRVLRGRRRTRRSGSQASTTTGIRSPRASPVASTPATTSSATRSRCPRARRAWRSTRTSTVRRTSSTSRTNGIVLTPDSNGRCDIYGPAPVGHATITRGLGVSGPAGPLGSEQQDLERAHQDDELRVEQGLELHPEEHERGLLRRDDQGPRSAIRSRCSGRVQRSGVPGLGAHDRT